MVDSAPASQIAGLGYLDGDVYLELYEVDSILVWDPNDDVVLTTLSVSADLVGGLTGAADLGLLFDSNDDGKVFVIDRTRGTCSGRSAPAWGPWRVVLHT